MRGEFSKIIFYKILTSVLTLFRVITPNALTILRQKLSRDIIVGSTFAANKPLLDHHHLLKWRILLVNVTVG